MYIYIYIYTCAYIYIYIYIYIYMGVRPTKTYAKGRSEREWMDDIIGMHRLDMHGAKMGVRRSRWLGGGLFTAGNFEDGIH